MCHIFFQDFYLIKIIKIDPCNAPFHYIKFYTNQIHYTHNLPNRAGFNRTISTADLLVGLGVLPPGEDSAELDLELLVYAGDCGQNIRIILPLLALGLLLNPLGLLSLEHLVVEPHVLLLSPRKRGIAGGSLGRRGGWFATQHPHGTAAGGRRHRADAHNLHFHLDLEFLDPARPGYFCGEE